MTRNRVTTGWLSAAAIAGALLFTSSAQAQERRHDADERLAATLRQLDAATRDARAQARHDGDKQLADRMKDFERKVASFRNHLEDRKLTDEDVRHDLKELNEHSRKIQQSVVSDQRIAPETADRWRRVVRLVDDLNDDYRAALGLEALPRGTSGTDRDDYPYDREDDIDRYESGRLSTSQLAADLDSRVHHAAVLADQAGSDEIASAVSRFADRVSSFTRDAGTSSRDDVRERARGLLGQARDVQRSLTRRDASPVLVAEWNRVMDSLERLARIE